MPSPDLSDAQVAAIARRFEVYVDRSGGPDACHPWRGQTSKGYGWFGVRWAPGPKGAQPIGAHRVAFYLEHRFWPEETRHTCDNGICVNHRHLLAGDHSANVADRHARNRWHRPYKLTPEQRAQLRQDYATGAFSQPELGKKYGISQQTVSAIIGRKRWADQDLNDGSPSAEELALISGVRQQLINYQRRAAWGIVDHGDTPEVEAARRTVMAE